MIVVIIAGGSGTRLWPLSTPDYPKHLLNINGDDRSLLQNTYERAKLLSDRIYIVSEVSHIDHVKAQLPDLAEEAFIVEPSRRGTASCIIASLVRIAEQAAADEPIVILSADHYVRDVDGFVHSFKVATQTSSEYKRIVLVGVEPDYPATGFGYIQKGTLIDERTFVFNVHSFKEKPDHNTAVGYVASGKYLWNCGYFVGSINTFKTAMEQHAPEMFSNYQKLVSANKDNYNGIYQGFENISIDYALIEKVPDLLVVPASFDWMDLGSFNDLHKAVGSDDKGNHVHGNVETEDLTNSFIQNYEAKPVAVIGLDNVVVINTLNGILVARKDLAQKVGDVSKRFNNK
jgi:mannose-1-phosphate guanylyltransferase